MTGRILPASLNSPLLDRRGVGGEVLLIAPLMFPLLRGEGQQGEFKTSI